MSGFFGGLMRVLDVTRRVVVNVLFVIIVVFLLTILFAGDDQGLAEIEDGIAVRFDPYGRIVEDYDQAPVDRVVNEALGEDIPQIRLRDLRQALEFASTDARVSTIVLDLNGLAPTSVSKLAELGEPLAAARTNGKQVLVYADNYDQSRYFLAAHGSEVFLHPMGGVLIEGYGAYRVYMKEALDKLSVDWHVFKAGDYKSYGEPYERNEMSPQVRAETRVWLGELWSFYQERVESARSLERGTIAHYLDGIVDGVRATRGHLAAYAADSGLVDVQGDHDQFVERVAAIVGAGENGDGYRGLGWEQYLASARQERAFDDVGRDRIAVLIANGAIVEGDPGIHMVGSQRMLSLLEQAMDDENVKALVLRVDSPGGSAFASEEIRAAIAEFRDTGRPVVVSMSSVAASGGYWISMGADEVWASPASITGSIGVIAMVPTFPRTMDRLGLHTDGVATTALAGALRPDRPLSEDAASLVQLLVDGIYGDFVELVSTSRELDETRVLELAGGRVYSGQGAHALGLVDELGGFDDAVAAAARLAGLDEYAVRVLERPLTFQERLMLSLLEADATASVIATVRGAERPAMKLLRRVEAELGWLPWLDSSRGITKAYSYCFCDAP